MSYFAAGPLCGEAPFMARSQVPNFADNFKAGLSPRCVERNKQRIAGRRSRPEPQPRPRTLVRSGAPTATRFEVGGARQRRLRFQTERRLQP